MRPTIEPWGVPTSKRHYYNDFPSKSKWCPLLSSNDEKKNENLTGSCITHMFAKKTSILAPAKNLLNIKCCSSSSNRHIKNPSSISLITVERSAVDRQDLTSLGKSEKRPHLSRWLTSQSIYTRLQKILPVTERRLTGLYFITRDLFSTSGKQVSFKHLEKTWKYVGKSDTEFFRATSEIKSDPKYFRYDIQDYSRSI